METDNWLGAMAFWGVWLIVPIAVDGFVAHWNAHEAHPFRWVFRGRFKRRAA